jgi:adenylyl-sulfate kinase
MNHNIKWHKGDITYLDRCRLLKQKGIVLWFTGLSGSGKSTIAVNLEKTLFEKDCLAYRLDGDNVRHHLSQGLGFTDNDRFENIRRISIVAHLLCDAGIIVLVSCISPCSKMRQLARDTIGKACFKEIFVKASIDTCRRRDPKKLYEKADQGNLNHFTGIDSIYKPPTQPDLVLDTEKATPEESNNQLLKYLTLQGVI